MGTKLTVCIPVRNTAAYLGDAIKSVLRQTYAEFDLIVCDNASSDGSFEIAKSFDDPRISVQRSEVVLSVGANWNRCLSLAKGAYISILHADDVMYPDNLAQKVAFLDSHADVGMVHSNVELIDDHGKRLTVGWQNQPAATGVEQGLPLLLRMAFGNPICASSVVLRRRILTNVGVFDDKFGFALDWDLWLRMALEAPVGYVQEPLVAYRVHLGQVTEELVKAGQTLPEEHRILEGFLERAPNDRKLRSTAWRGQALRAVTQVRRHLRRGELKAACRVLAYAVKIYPALALDREALARLFRPPSVSKVRALMGKVDP